MQKSQLFAGVAGIALALTAANAAHASTAVLINPSQLPVNGTQNFNNSFGNDFNVNSAITVSQLGVFDNGQNGLSTDGTQPITATLYNRTTGLAVTGGSIGFGGNTGSDGTLVDGYRFKSISPITLQPGQYSIITDFYSQPGHEENFYNAGGNTNNTVVRDTGGGLITFVGSGRYDPAQHNGFPTANIDGGSEPIHYDAGTFVFTAATPEPTSLGLLAVMATGSMLYRRRRA